MFRLLLEIEYIAQVWTQPYYGTIEIIKYFLVLYWFPQHFTMRAAECGWDCCRTIDLIVIKEDDNNAACCVHWSPNNSTQNSPFHSRTTHSYAPPMDHWSPCLVATEFYGNWRGPMTSSFKINSSIQTLPEAHISFYVRLQLCFLLIIRIHPDLHTPAFSPSDLHLVPFLLDSLTLILVPSLAIFLITFLVLTLSYLDICIFFHCNISASHPQQCICCLSVITPEGNNLGIWPGRFIRL